ncbi:MAG: GNAT family N-acetyltransferase [Micromonosporaceae bacterium]
MNEHPGWPAILADGPVTLRPYQRGDALTWSEIRRANRDWLRPWEPNPPQSWEEANSPAVFRALLRELKRSGRHGTSMPWAVCYENRLVGALTLGNIVRRAFCSAYAGYWVDGRVAGRGVMPRALALAVDHAFGPGRLHRIEVNIRPENIPSRRVVEKLGFREESFHRRYLHIGGDWRDHVGYALTVEDLAGDGTLLARWHRLRQP